ncbi:MAG TPA: choice-of-anchor J domain-containing protein, partial [Cyclobacteriaceae bacterium]|nr:choice-of-anchor J domain-containing protein [Cyclobacteriaceae bacterium]
TSTDIIPLRQNFESPFVPAWTIVSQGSQRLWQAYINNNDTSLVYRAFGNTALGSEAWFVSPQLDFSKAQEASLFFHVSYAKSTFGNEVFRILASTDCGVTYPDVVYYRTGDQLAVTNYNSAWSPVLASDWRKEYVDLSNLAGKENVRLAFVVTNNRGNNLYLDNLEFFTDSNPSPPSFTLRQSSGNPSYFIYNSSDPDIFKITFNFQQKEQVRMLIYNAMGQIMVDNVLPETLNQTYTVDFTDKSTGIYIVRLLVENYVGTQKIFVGH